MVRSRVESSSRRLWDPRLCGRTEGDLLPDSELNCLVVRGARRAGGSRMDLVLVTEEEDLHLYFFSK